VRGRPGPRSDPVPLSEQHVVKLWPVVFMTRAVAPTPWLGMADARGAGRGSVRPTVATLAASQRSPSRWADDRGDLGAAAWLSPSRSAAKPSTTDGVVKATLLQQLAMRVDGAIFLTPAVF
jgi:hypothetical protein